MHVDRLFDKCFKSRQVDLSGFEMVHVKMYMCIIYVRYVMLVWDGSTMCSMC